VYIASLLVLYHVIFDGGGPIPDLSAESGTLELDMYKTIRSADGIVVHNEA